MRPTILLSVTRRTKNWFTISPTAVAYHTTIGFCCVCIMLNNIIEIAVGPIRVSFRLLYKTISEAKAGDLFLIKRDSSKPNSTPRLSRVASKQGAIRPMAPRTLNQQLISPLRGSSAPQEMFRTSATAYDALRT